MKTITVAITFMIYYVTNNIGCPVGLCIHVPKRYENTNIMFLDIIHRPFFFYQHRPEDETQREMSRR
jgi:hypothetical protein